MTTIKDSHSVAGDYVSLDGEQYYCISNSHLMPDFFMSLVGASDHWMFVSSRGALTAGRRNSDHAIFPYSSDDQISVAQSTTGCFTAIRIAKNQQWANEGSTPVWQPFATTETLQAPIRQNLYKTAAGDKLVLEEVNENLELTFRYGWAFSEQFGFVRTCCLTNHSLTPKSLDLLDGFRNLLPPGVGTEFQMRYSNLGNAYKKAELLTESELGIFYLSSIPSDCAEPSEGLFATTVWQSGLSPCAVLLSSEQLSAFQAGKDLTLEDDVRGKACAYLAHQQVQLDPGETLRWTMVVETGQDHSTVVDLNQRLREGRLGQSEVADSVAAGQQELLRILSSSDAIQCSNNPRRANRHLSNTVFNVMRGGIPLDNYQIPIEDFSANVRQFNTAAFDRNQKFLSGLPRSLSAADLRRRIEACHDGDLHRLMMEYLPLAFSRRHGDPTRPWNQFSIDIRSTEGNTNLNYQGNWRDIFQNWEALGVSFPGFLESMVCRFVNSTTADGYNPYRLTKDGFEWEEPSPEDPWANIGYWGDHQIIYLLKLLEWSARFNLPGVESLLSSDNFVHANVPYRILDAEQIRKDPRNTIEFDATLAATIEERVALLGADGKLSVNQKGDIHTVSLVEKLLTLSLAKLSCFVPDGGIWLNTQRPEWNDANNALVGNGLSLVTTCYLKRWFSFLQQLLNHVDSQDFRVSTEVVTFMNAISDALKSLDGSFGTLTPRERETAVERLSRAGSDYRRNLYDNRFSGTYQTLSSAECLEFFRVAERQIESTIKSNRRPDGLYHSYNLMHWTDDGIAVDHLYKMLEGQVAVLSSGMLDAESVADLLDVLRQSDLYRRNQNSYLLYPDRQLPRFIEKNRVSPDAVNGSSLLQSLLSDGNSLIICRDIQGDYHFSGDLRNSADLKSALKELPSKYSSKVEAEAQQLVELYEDTFGHREFTGRSGTFFAYEGLGSIYWHMVSKLALAVSENYLSAEQGGTSLATLQRLKEHLIEIRSGIGAEKCPSEYGAFPTDPYSHTPENAGVKQPGMTGQVKEDVLARFAEIGIQIEHGCLCFRLGLFDTNELVEEDSGLTFYDLDGKLRTMHVPAGGFGFTLFQVPIIYQPADGDSVVVHFSDGRSQTFQGMQLDEATSRQLFSREGNVLKVEGRFKALNR